MLLVIKMANRKQRRKLKETKYEEDEQNIKTTVIMLSIVVIVFVIFYFITVVINNKNRKLNTVDTPIVEATIQYDEILASQTFSMKPVDYYVLFYDFNCPEAVYFDYVYEEFNKEHNIYKVDLSKGFNEKYVSEQSNESASKASELKVKNGTLIRIINGKNVSYFDGNSQLLLSELNDD